MANNHRNLNRVQPARSLATARHGAAHPSTVLAPLSGTEDLRSAPPETLDQAIRRMEHEHRWTRAQIESEIQHWHPGWSRGQLEESMAKAGFPAPPHRRHETHFYPYDRKLLLGRTDAGVDSKRPHHGPIFAIGDSVVVKVDRPGTRAWGGLGAVYFKLKHPITVNGRTYRYWYSAEAGQYNSSFKPGTVVKGGHQVGFTKSGWQETGFFSGQDMSSKVATLPGRDFRHFLQLMRARDRYAPGA